MKQKLTRQALNAMTPVLYRNDINGIASYLSQCVRGQKMSLSTYKVDSNEPGSRINKEGKKSIAKVEKFSTLYWTQCDYYHQSNRSNDRPETESEKAERTSVLWWKRFNSEEVGLEHGKLCNLAYYHVYRKVRDDKKQVVKDENGNDKVELVEDRSKVYLICEMPNNPKHLRTTSRIVITYLDGSTKEVTKQELKDMEVMQASYFASNAVPSVTFPLSGILAINGIPLK